MNDTTKLGLTTLLGGLILGVSGDALPRATPWGLNAPLWTLLLVALVVALARWRNVELAGGGRWMVFPALFFAAAFAWRDSATLGVVNTLALLAALSVAAIYAHTGRIGVSGIVDYVKASFVTAAATIVHPIVLLMDDIRWKEIPRTGATGQAVAVVRGLFIAIPLVLVFGGLFVAADAVFEGMVNSLFQWNLGEALNHILVSLGFAWLAAGFLRLLLAGAGHLQPGQGRSQSPRLGFVEISIVLGSLNLLFLAFVVVQFRYFFGGAAMVGDATNLTYAEYARRGFFELVTVAALVLPLLLAIDWAVPKDNRAHVRVFRLLALILVVAVFVIMASALQRMLMYQTEYGMTELRLYTTAFMGWIAVVFLWFVNTALRGRRERFACGMLVSGFLAIAVLNVMNPDAFIVRTNVGRLKAEQPLDARYVSSLSADAVPALVEALPAIPDKERQAIAKNVVARWSGDKSPDWRTWNWGRSQAREITAANEALLREATAGR